MDDGQHKLLVVTDLQSVSLVTILDAIKVVRKEGIEELDPLIIAQATGNCLRWIEEDGSSSVDDVVCLCESLEFPHHPLPGAIKYVLKPGGTMLLYSPPRYWRTNYFCEVAERKILEYGFLDIQSSSASQPFWVMGKKPSSGTGSSFSSRETSQALLKVQSDDDVKPINEDSLQIKEDVKKRQKLSGDAVDVAEVKARLRAQNSMAKGAMNKHGQSKAVSASDVSDRRGVDSARDGAMKPHGRDRTNNQRARSSPPPHACDKSSPVMRDISISTRDASGKRPKEEALTLPPHRSSSKSLMEFGVNRAADGVESFWDDEDPGLAWKKAHPIMSSYDTERLSSKHDYMLLESVASDCMRTLHVAAHFDERLTSLKRELAQVQAEAKKSAEECVYQKELLQQEKVERHKLSDELEGERKNGTYFLQSEAGQLRLAEAAKAVIEEFKKSVEC